MAAADASGMEAVDALLSGMVAGAARPPVVVLLCLGGREARPRSVFYTLCKPLPNVGYISLGKAFFMFFKNVGRVSNIALEKYSPVPVV
jgi:hypothetical protein